MTIKAKILIPMIIFTLIAAGAILVSNIVQFSDYVNTSISDRVNNASSVAEDKFETLKNEARNASLKVSENNSLKKEIISGNHDSLMTLANQLQKENKMELCIITDANGTILIRTHVPDKFGDDGSAIPTIKAALSGTTLTTAEIGAAIPMAISSGSPIYDDDGKIMGALVLGTRLDTNSFVDSIKTILGCEVTVFAGDKRISTTVVKEDGTRAVGTQAAENVSKSVLAGNTYSGKAVILNNNALTKYTPIYDFNNNVIGMLFVGRYTTEASNTILTFLNLGLLITALLLAISVPTILYIAKRIVNPINIMVKAADSLAEGDTEIDLKVYTKDEMHKLGKSFNEMIINTQNQVHIIEKIAEGDLTLSVNERSNKDVMNRALKSMLKKNNEAFSQISTSSNEVLQGAHHMSEMSQKLAQSSSEQSSTLQNLLSAINEITDKTEKNVDMAVRAADLSNDIKDNAEKGSGQMNEMMDAVNDINNASREINKVIKVIDDIAFQTNILALNAAVEAARAGEHGKGFAVVAEEVRSLAAKSAEAAKETGELITNTIQKAEVGVIIANQTSESLVKIVQGINENSQIMGDIATSSEVQSQAISQINKGVDEVAQLVHNNSANAQEGAMISEEMSGQAIALEGLISQFKIKND